MSKFCPYCGTEAEDKAMFCTECGKRLDVQEQQAQPVQYAQPVQPVQQQNYYQPNNTQQYQQNPNYYAQPQQYQQKPAAPPKKPGKGLGIASLVLGIFAIINSLILCILDMIGAALIGATSTDDVSVSAGFSVVIAVFAGFVAFLALLSLIFGIISIIKSRRGPAIAGLIMASISILVCIISFVIVARMPKQVDYYNSVYGNSQYGNEYEDWED